MLGLEWTDIDLSRRQLCVARSDWRGYVSAPKGGRIRYVPLTRRLVIAGHQDLGTTQCYMHLSPAALDAAIRLLDCALETRGGIVQAPGTGA